MGSDQAIDVDDLAPVEQTALLTQYARAVDSGWQWNIVPLLKIPGVTNVHRDLPLTDKQRRARDRKLWADSAIVRVQLT